MFSGVACTHASLAQRTGQPSANPSYKMLRQQRFTSMCQRSRRLSRAPPPRRLEAVVALEDFAFPSLRRIADAVVTRRAQQTEALRRTRDLVSQDIHMYDRICRVTSADELRDAKEAAAEGTALLWLDLDEKATAEDLASIGERMSRMIQMSTTT